MITARAWGSIPLSDTGVYVNACAFNTDKLLSPCPPIIQLKLKFLIRMNFNTSFNLHTKHRLLKWLTNAMIYEAIAEVNGF